MTQAPPRGQDRAPMSDVPPSSAIGDAAAREPASGVPGSRPSRARGMQHVQRAFVIAVLTLVAVAHFRFRGREALFWLVLATMMRPGAVTMIPSFLIWNALGFVGTLVPLWAGNLFASAFYVFLLRQFMLGLPRELFDAARVDGASQ